MYIITWGWMHAVAQAHATVNASSSPLEY